LRKRWRERQRPVKAEGLILAKCKVFGRDTKKISHNLSSSYLVICPGDGIQGSPLS
jgi:hypothetical protein